MSVTSNGPAIAVLTDEAWTSCSVTFDDGGGPQVYAPSAGVSDAYSLALDLTAWLDSTFGTTSEASVRRSALVIAFGSSGWTWTANATAQTVLGIDATGGPTNRAGLFLPSLLLPSSGGLADWAQSVGERKAAAQGSISPQAPGTAAYRPRLDVIITEEQAAQWRSTLESASNPRQCYCWHNLDQTWRLLTLGRAVPERRPGPLFRLAPEVYG